MTTLQLSTLATPLDMKCFTIYKYAHFGGTVNVMVVGEHASDIFALLHDIGDMRNIYSTLHLVNYQKAISHDTNGKWFSMFQRFGKF